MIGKDLSNRSKAPDVEGPVVLEWPVIRTRQNPGRRPPGTDGRGCLSQPGKLGQITTPLLVRPAPIGREAKPSRPDPCRVKKTAHMVRAMLVDQVGDFTHAKMEAGKSSLLRSSNR